MGGQTYRRIHRRRILGGAYSAKLLSYSPIAYWPLWEPSGAVAGCQVNPAQNGAYTGVTLGETGIGDGQTCPLFDGANDVVNVYTAALTSAFDPSEGSFLAWARVADVSVWTDNTARNIALLREDANNRIVVQKMSTDNTLRFIYEANNNVEEILVAALTTTDWMSLLLTWSFTDNEVMAYYNGAWQETDTGLGTWVGTLDSDSTCIGASRSATPQAVFDGWIAHVALFGAALDADAAADLAEV